MARKTIAQYKADAGKLEPLEDHGGYQVWAGHEWAEVRKSFRRTPLNTFRGPDAAKLADAYAVERSDADADLQWKVMTDFFY